MADDHVIDNGDRCIRLGHDAWPQPVDAPPALHFVKSWQHLAQARRAKAGRHDLNEISKADAAQGIVDDQRMRHRAVGRERGLGEFKLVLSANVENWFMSAVVISRFAPELLRQSSRRSQA